MASITITDPIPDSRVLWSFPAGGAYSTGPGSPDPNDQVVKGAEVVARLFDSGGQMVQTQRQPIAGNPPPPTGPWQVSFSVDQDYTTCSILAELKVNGATVASATLSPFDIKQE